MSTGAECSFTETEPGRWTYWLQEWPYGDWPEGHTYGPFRSFGEALKHLSDNHANPGGWSTKVHPTAHVHEPTQGGWVRGEPGYRWDESLTSCEACGEVMTKAAS